jgi:2-C-methyl-D-erythritol 4-phosphate cytidylyltransferase
VSPIAALPREVRAVVVILAAGSGERLGAGVPKAFVELAGRPLVALAASAAAGARSVDALVVAVPAGLRERAATLLEDIARPVAIVTGGDSRHASVSSALDAIPPGAEIIVCHDAARALAGPGLFDAVIDALETSSPPADGVVPGIPVRDTIKWVRGDEVVRTPAREDLVAVQTPQAFRAGALRAAHRRATGTGPGPATSFTDDAGAVEAAGGRVLVIPGDEGNRKITDEDDLRLAAARTLDAGRGTTGATRG